MIYIIRTERKKSNPLFSIIIRYSFIRIRTELRTKWKRLGSSQIY